MGLLAQILARQSGQRGVCLRRGQKRIELSHKTGSGGRHLAATGKRHSVAQWRGHAPRGAVQQGADLIETGFELRLGLLPDGTLGIGMGGIRV